MSDSASKPNKTIENAAWEPIELFKDGTCGTCRHIDWGCAYLTCPVKYRCRVTDRMHFLTDECDAEKEEQ